MRKLVLVFALVLVASVSAAASPVSLTSGELAGMTLISTSNPPASFAGFSNLLGGNYSAQWNELADGAVVSATSGITLGVGRGVFGDIFTITVINNNGNPWNFTVSINNGFMNTQSSGPFLINNNGGSQVFSFVLNNNGLQQVSITVGQLLPIAGVDRGAEYQVTNVPEPASMLLLGTGLVGLAGAARRKFRKS